MSSGNAFLNLFARSPFSPIQAHMLAANDCAQQLVTFFDQVILSDWDKATEIRLKINELEEQADQLKMDFRSHLPSNLMLPVPRLDLLQLVETQDKIANITKDISGIIIGRQMQLPKALDEQFMQYLNTSVAASEQAKLAIDDLDILLEAGFKGKAIALVDEMINKLNQLEKNSDNQQVVVRQALFSMEKDLAPIDVMFLYKIITWVGDLADTAQRVGSRLKMMVAD